MKLIKTLFALRRAVQRGDATDKQLSADGQTTSLDIVSEEMRQRVADQDSQAAILAAKASFLFTAGTTVLGASAALATLFVNEGEVECNAVIWSSIGVAGAYGWLTISFFMAFKVRTFQRVPAPKQLMKYSSLAKADSLRKVADGRRFAIEKNEKRLDCTARWVNSELICLMILINAVLVTLAILIIG